MKSKLQFTGLIIVVVGGEIHVVVQVVVAVDPIHRVHYDLR